MKKRILSMLLVIVMILSVVPVQALAAGVTITGQKYVMVGKTIKLTAKNAAAGDIQEWSSNDTTVATVTKVDGTNTCTVEGVGKGHTTITVRVNDVDYSAEIDVFTQEAAGSVAVTTTETDVTLGAGDVQLTYSSAVPDGEFKAVKWQSKDTTVATVTNAGVLTPLTEGSTDVRVWVNGRWSDYVTFTVKSAGSGSGSGSGGGSGSGSGGTVTPPPASLDGPLTVDNTNVVLNGYVNDVISADVPAGEDASKVQWSITSGDAVTITPSGDTCKITGVKVGKAVLHASLLKADNGVLSADIHVEVCELPATSIQFTSKQKTMAVGETFTPQVDMLPEGTTTVVRWESTKPAKASIDPVTGEITALSAGATLIRAYINDVDFVSYRLEVTQATSIVINPELPATLLAGKALDLKASVVDAAGNPVPGASVKWMLLSEDEGVDLEGSKLKTDSSMKYRHLVALRAEAVGCDALPVDRSLTVMPATQSIVLKVGDKKVNDKVYTVDMADPAVMANGVTISATILPETAEQSIRWDVADVGNVSIEQQRTKELNLTPISAMRPGIVTVTAYAGDGSGESSTVKIQFTRLGEGKLKNVPEKLRGGQSLNMKSYLDQDENVYDKSVTWSVQDNVVNGKTVASIGADGKLTTKAVTAPHTIKVTVTGSSGLSDTKEIILYPATKSITLRGITNTGIQINGASKTIKYADNMVINLTPTTKPANLVDANGDYPWKLTWTTSDKKVADVDDNGQVQILDAGNVRITCEAGDGTKVMAYLNLEITKDAASVQITAPANSLASTKSMNLTATVWAKKNIKAANQGVIWSITDEFGQPTSAATISPTGRLTAYTVDQNTPVVVTATSRQNQDISGSITLTIKPNTTKTLHAYIDGNMISGTYAMNLGESCVMDPVWQKSGNGNETLAQDCQFFSSNSKVATVDEDLGTLTAVGYGTSLITLRCVDPATKNECTATFTVKVMKKVGMVTITAPANRNLRSGKSVRLVATAWVDYVNRIKADNQSFTWEVTENGNETDVAVISANGTLTAKPVEKEHTVVVKAISNENGVSEPIEFKIYPAEIAKFYFKLGGEEYTSTLPVDLNKNLTNLTVRIHTAISNPDGSIADKDLPILSPNQLTWTTTNKNVVDVSTGVPVAKAVGKANLVARYKDTTNNRTYQATVTVTVSQTIGAIKSIEQSGVLVAGKSVNMRVVVKNTSATNKNVLWSVDDVPNAQESVKNLVQINPYSGRLTAKRSITKQIKVLVAADPVDGTARATKEVVVYPQTSKVNIIMNAQVVTGQKEFVSLANGKKITLTAVATPNDAYDAAFKWISTNTSVAVVDENGTVTLKGTGAATIKAIAQDGTNKTAKFTLRVTK